MFRIKKRSRKLTLLMVFFATFFLSLNGLAIAGEEGVHAGGHESAEGVHEEGHGADRSGDLRDLLYRAINFALLVAILFFGIRKTRLKESLKGRIEEIKQRFEELKKEKEEAENRYLDIAKKLKHFEEQRKEIVEQFQKEGMEERERIIAEAKERVKEIIEQAEWAIQQEMQSAKDRLRGEVVDLAAQKARELIAKKITDKDQDRLVNEFIEKVGKIH